MTEDETNDASDATAALLREKSEEIGALRERLEHAAAREALQKRTAESLRSEVTDLRAQLLDALLGNARLRGYIDGKQESAPPTMVPAPRLTPDWIESRAPDYQRRPHTGDRPLWFAK